MELVLNNSAAATSDNYYKYLLGCITFFFTKNALLIFSPIRTMLEAIKLIFIFYRSLICKSSVCNIFDKILSINLLFLLSTYIVPIRLGMIKYEAMFH